MQQHALMQQFMQTDTSTPMDQATLMREAMRAQSRPQEARGAPDRLGPIKRMINEAVVGRVLEPLVQRAEAARVRCSAAATNMANQMSAAIEQTARVKKDILKTQSDEERYAAGEKALLGAKFATDLYAQFKATEGPDLDPVQKEIEELLKDEEEYGEDLLSFGEDKMLGNRPFVGAGEVSDQLKMLHDLYARYGVFHNVGPGPDGRHGAHGTLAPAESFNPAAIGDY